MRALAVRDDINLCFSGEMQRLCTRVSLGRSGSPGEGRAMPYSTAGVVESHLLQKIRIYHGSTTLSLPNTIYIQTALAASQMADRPDSDKGISTVLKTLRKYSTAVQLKILKYENKDDHA